MRCHMCIFRGQHGAAAPADPSPSVLLQNTTILCQDLLNAAADQLPTGSVLQQPQNLLNGGPPPWQPSTAVFAAVVVVLLLLGIMLLGVVSASPLALCCTLPGGSRSLTVGMQVFVGLRRWARLPNDVSALGLRTTAQCMQPAMSLPSQMMLLCLQAVLAGLT